MNDLNNAIKEIRALAFLDAIAEIMRSDDMPTYQRVEAINCVLKAAGYAMEKAE